MSTNEKYNADLIDSLVDEWELESPGLDASAMSVIGRIMRLGRLFERDAQEVLKPFGLSYTEFDIIATMRRKGPPYMRTPVVLSREVILTSGAMTAALDRLEAAGLITRETDAKDRRIKAAKLTELGIKTAEKAARERFKTARASLVSLSTSDIEELRDQLKKLKSSDRR